MHSLLNLPSDLFITTDIHMASLQYHSPREKKNYNNSFSSFTPVLKSKLAIHNHKMFFIQNIFPVFWCRLFLIRYASKLLPKNLFRYILSKNSIMIMFHDFEFNFHLTSWIFSIYILFIIIVIQFIIDIYLHSLSE